MRTTVLAGAGRALRSPAERVAKVYAKQTSCKCRAGRKNNVAPKQGGSTHIAIFRDASTAVRATSIISTPMTQHSRIQGRFGMTVVTKNIETLALHGGSYRSDLSTGAVAVPIYQTMSYQFENSDSPASFGV
jgi:hypothetical protein